MDKSQLIADAIDTLRELGVGKDQQNERSAMTLLALLQLKPGDNWQQATNPMLGTRAIMDWIRDYYEVDYKPNTRETIRRFTLHQFVIAELVEENADRPDRPINSPKWNYRITNGQKLDKLANHNQYETNKMPYFEPLSHYTIDNNKLEQYKKTWAHNPEVHGSNPCPATNNARGRQPTRLAASCVPWYKGIKGTPAPLQPHSMSLNPCETRAQRRSDTRIGR